VGGTVRDLLLGRVPGDIDLVVAGDPEPLARAFADSIGGGFFVLSEEFKACRAISPEGLNYDFSALRGRHIVEDLGYRDFTANALAIELPRGGVVEPFGGSVAGGAIDSGGVTSGGALIDPFGGAAHLAGRELVPVSDSIFDDDPLRLLRAVRLEKGRGLVIGPALARAINDKSVLASRPAVERIFFELSLLLEPPGAAATVRRLDEMGLLEVLFPELTTLKGITQNEFHHLDVFNHVLASVEALERIVMDPEEYFPGRGASLTELLDRPVAGDAGRRLVLVLAALFHDVAKPNCRFTDHDGLVRFFEHDRLGAELTAVILARFRISNDAVETVVRLVRRHMRFEGLVQQDVPSDRARLRYLNATAPTSRESIMLSVSDRMAVRGVRVTEDDIRHHLALAREMMDFAFAIEEAVPLPRLLGGDELMTELGLKPGPLLGELLGRIQEEQQLGNISTRGEALELAREGARELAARSEGSSVE